MPCIRSYVDQKLLVKLTPVNPATSDTSSHAPNANSIHDRDGRWSEKYSTRISHSAKVISMMTRAYIALPTT